MTDVTVTGDNEVTVEVGSGVVSNLSNFDAAGLQDGELVRWDNAAGQLERLDLSAAAEGDLVGLTAAGVPKIVGKATYGQVAQRNEWTEGNTFWELWAQGTPFHNVMAHVSDAILDAGINIRDGASHPLSDAYATLADAQADYPDATALTQECAWAAMRKARNAARDDARGAVFVPIGTFITEGIDLVSRVRVVGIGPMSEIKQQVGVARPLVRWATTEETFTDLIGVLLHGQSSSQTDPNDGINLDRTGTSDASIIPRARVLDVQVRNVKGRGCYLGFAARHTVVDGLDIYFADQEGLVVETADSQVDNVNVGQSGLDGVVVSGASTQLSNVKSWKSGRLGGAGEGHGFRIAGSRTTLVNGYSQENKENGFYAFRSGTVLQSIQLLACTSDSDGSSTGTTNGFYLFRCDSPVVVGTVTKSPSLPDVVDHGLFMDSSTVNADIALTVNGTNELNPNSVLGANRVVINGVDQAADRFPAYPVATATQITLSQIGPFANFQPLVDRLYLCGALQVARPRTLSEVAVEVQTAGDGSAVVRFGVAKVSDSGLYEGQTLTSLGSIDGTLTGERALAGLSHSLTPGWHLFFAATNGETSAAPTVRGAGPWLPPGFAFERSLAALRGRTALFGAADVTGALPGTVPALANDTDTAPILGIKYSA